MCHTDAVLANGWLPGTVFPAVPGHEIAGRIDALGEGVSAWRVGQRVGVGWFGGSCGTCAVCRSGNFADCPALQVPRVAYPGGYADAVVVPPDAAPAHPAEPSAVAAGTPPCPAGPH